MAVHVSRMDPVIGKGFIDKVEFVTPRHLDGEEPVVKSQGPRNRQTLKPSLAASHDGRSADKILFEQRRQFVSFKVPSLMFPIASRRRFSTILVDHGDISVNQPYFRITLQDGQDLLQKAGPVTIVGIDSGDVPAAGRE